MIIQLICLFVTYTACTGLNTESPQRTPHEIIVEINLRNLLIIRHTFPTDPKYWESTALEQQYDALRPKARRTVKKMFKFVRSKAKAVGKYAVKTGKKVVREVVDDVKDEIRKGYRDGKEEIKNEIRNFKDEVIRKPVREFAREVVTEVKNVAVGFVKDGLDILRNPKTTTGGAKERTKVWTCFYNPDSWWNIGGACWSFESLYIRSRYAQNLANKLLNELADPRKKIRKMIQSVTRQLVECKNMQLKGIQPGQHLLLYRKIWMIVEGLLKVSEALAVTAIEVEDSD